MNTHTLVLTAQPSGLPGLGLDLLTAPKNEGFTAGMVAIQSSENFDNTPHTIYCITVILTYNRVNTLFEIIRNLGRVQSLTKVSQVVMGDF